MRVLTCMTSWQNVRSLHFQCLQAHNFETPANTMQKKGVLSADWAHAAVQNAFVAVVPVAGGPFLPKGTTEAWPASAVWSLKATAVWAWA